MMGRRTYDQEQFFYSFRLDEAVPDDHAVREIAAVLDLSWVHAELAPYYPSIGRPSIDPVLMIRMLIVGCERTQECFDIKPERLAADTAYGSAANLNWLVNDKQIAPHIPVIDKSKREDGSSRARTSPSTRRATSTSVRRSRSSPRPARS